MERDIRKGLLLLKKSADAGYAPAFERLVQIFSNGIGIREDHRCALNWQKAYVKHLEENLGTAFAPEKITKYFDEVFRVTDICIDLLNAENAPVITRIGDRETPESADEKHKHGGTGAEYFIIELDGFGGSIWRWQ